MHLSQQHGITRRRHSWLPRRPPWDQLCSMPLSYGHLLHPLPVLTNCNSCGTQHWGLPHDAHKTQQYAWRNTHTSHTRAPTVTRLTIQTDNTTSITSPTYNILQYSMAKTLSSTTPTTQQTLQKTSIQSLQHTEN